MYDYVRWIFGLEFCTPRYLISRELGLMKLSVWWGLRARRYEKRLQLERAGRIARKCWKEKRQYGWRYVEEKEKYLNRIEWDMEIKERIEWNREEIEKEIIETEKCRLRKEEEERIKKARYNKRYKEFKVLEGCPRYLKAENLEEIDKGEVRALVKLKCGNLKKCE